MRTEEACQRPYEEVAQQLGTDLRRGLSWREANRRLVSLGPNEFEVRQEEPLWKKYSEQGIVINTGEKSEFGDIFKMMQAEEAPKTPLQKSMDNLGKQLSLYSFGIIGLIMLLGWIQGRPVLEMFNIGVSLAVAAIPEGLPIVVTVTLALGVMRMAKRKAIIKKLPTVETLGCVNVVCSDKTGTLTKNEMTVCSVMTSELYHAEVTGVGYNADGHVILTEGGERDVQMDSLRLLLECGCICNNADILGSELRGQPTEGSLLAVAHKMGIYDVRNHYVRLQEIPFSSEHKMMAVKVIPKFGGEQEQYFVKGALSKILAHCTHYSSHGVAVPMSTERASQYIKEAQFMGRKGLRVLSLASGTHLNQLKFLGLVGILDPPRPGVREAIETLHSSGVNVKMLTGDAEETACTVAGNVVLSGDQLDTMTDMELQRIIGSVSVFYRTAPGHKLRIVKVSMIATWSIAALSLIALSTLMKIPNPLNAMQILWINIIMDGPPAQSLGVEPVDHDVLKQPPRNTKQPMITRDLIFNVVLSSLIIILGTLFIFRNEVHPKNKVMPDTCQSKFEDKFIRNIE
ncbi:E1-E2 ATPase, putative [Ixodes scapularis]|uniref:E1-E2 ATPase, putative n=1 Tax=Ixodes scapularis TaxID=6945 RepID=B7PRX8_IXOSC|nr:E1-E2 ATPase, putative [Ixodes scapularis]|eukprot:XP_002401327.1 E1-E2 ATPase, putative [Ixodes scapularis]